MTSPPTPSPETPPSSDAVAQAAARGRAQRIESFVYGTIATLIAMSAFETVGGTDGVQAGAIVIVSAAATWFAHAFSTILGARLALGEPTTWRRVWRGLREAWPIVIAAIPATVFAAGATQDLWTLEGAVRASNVVGVLVMAGAGFAAARVTGASALSTIVWVVGTASIGFAIVIVELAVHH